MRIEAQIRDVQEQLVASAALGDDAARSVARTLAGAASPALRLAILSALAVAAEEITAALLDTPGAPAVAVQMDPDEIRISVTLTSIESEPPPRADDADASARISLRLSEGLKTEIDGAASRAGLSVNTWLVRAAATALRASGNPHGPSGARDRDGRAQHISGWIN